LHPEIRIKFKEVENDVGSWKYTDRGTSGLHRLCTLEE
jgi:hypothetical protein